MHLILPLILTEYLHTRQQSVPRLVLCFWCGSCCCLLAWVCERAVAAVVIVAFLNSDFSSPIAPDTVFLKLFMTCVYYTLKNAVKNSTSKLKTKHTKMEPGLSGIIVKHFPLWVSERHAVPNWVSLGSLSGFWFFLLDLFYCLGLRGICSFFCGHWEYNRNMLFIFQGHHKCLKSTEFWLESSPRCPIPISSLIWTFPF